MRGKKSVGPYGNIAFLNLNWTVVLLIINRYEAVLTKPTFNLLCIIFSIPICPPSAPEKKTDRHSSPVTKIKCKDLNPTPGLEKCFDPHCRKRNSSQTCVGIVGCFWCKNDKDDVPLKQPYCASSEMCFRGKEGILL